MTVLHGSSGRTAVVAQTGVLCIGLSACTPLDFESADTAGGIDVDTIELWQHGVPVTLEAAREEESAEVWIEPAPFELWFEGCMLATTTVFASDRSRGFVGRPPDAICAATIEASATFGRCFTVALEPNTHWLYHNRSDQLVDPWRVTLLDPRTGAQPVPDRPGWCRFEVAGLRLDGRSAYEPLETLDTNGDVLVISAWNDLDRDGVESIGELLHIHLQL